MVETYEGFEEKLKDLNCAVPVGISFLPENIESANHADEFIFRETSAELRKVLLNHDCGFADFVSGNRKYKVQKNADWIGPTLFIGSAILTENPELVNVAINLISSYLYDLFKGDDSTREIEFQVIYQDGKKSFKKIKYRGSVANFKTVFDTLNKLK